MFIKKLEIQGFKSFSERIKLIFHPGITAIVGPNGTGKSNIVDSLLWVLKARKVRSLRGERSGDVIFNGNTKIAPKSMADVSLALGNENEELIINHRAFRSGENEYRLDGKVVRLKDIQDALWKKSIGEADYFVIEQGSIGVFLSSKPLEKRFFLEEAAGTAFYKDKKRQAQNKLVSSEQNLIRLEDILIEVQKASNSLKRQAHAAIRYRKIREKIRELTLYLYWGKLDKLEKTQEEIASSYRKSLELEKEIISRLKIEEKTLAEKRTEVWNLEKSNKENQENLFRLRTQISNFESEKEKEAKRIDFIEEEKTRANENINEFSQESGSLEKEKNDIKNNLSGLHESLDQKQKELEKAEKKSRSIQDELAAEQENIKTQREEHLQKISTRTEIKNEAAKIEKELEILLRQEEKLKKSIEEEKSLLGEKEKQLEQAQTKISREKKDLESKQKELRETQETFNSVVSAQESLQNQIDELASTKEKDSHHLHSLEKLKEKERGSASSSEIPGTIGLLADYIDSEIKNTHLIDAFWRGEVKATVIQARDFLNNIPGKELKGDYFLLSPEKKVKTSPEVFLDKRVLGSLKSAVKLHPKIKDYMSAFTEAAVVENIENAINLWLQYPSCSFITTNGDLLLSSGLLQMGQKKEGIFTLIKEIKTLEEKIAAAEKKITPLQSQIQETIINKQKLSDKIQEFTKQADYLERAITDSEKEKEFDMSEKEKIDTNVSILKQELEVLAADKKVLSEKLGSISSRTDQLEEEERNFKTTMELAEKNLIHLRQKNEEGRSLFFQLKSNIDILNEKITNMESQIESIKSRKKTIESRIETLKKENQNADIEKTKNEENIHSLTQKIRGVKKEREDKEESLTQKEILLKSLLKEQQDKEIKIEEWRADSESRKEERMHWEVKKAEKERDLANIEETCWQDLKKTIQEVKDEVIIENIPEIDIEKTVEEEKEKLQRFSAVNLMAEEEYLIQKKRLDFLTQQKNDLHESIDSTKEAIRKIDHESKNQFMSAFDEVNKNFKDVFSSLFEGGHAELKLADPSLPLDSGIEIVAQPPGKRVQNLSLLSGGEKSLTTLAFFFALFRYKPTPFCILDEVDAALDEVNLTRFLNLMKEIKKQTQFIIITHNFKTMEVADYIYGTTMAEPNVTSIYAVKMEKGKMKPEK